MHIVYLVHAFPAFGGLSAGGAGNYVYTMATTMKAYGHEIDIVTESKENKIYDLDGIKLHHINATIGFKDTGRHMSTVAKFLKNLSRTFWYNREVRKINKRSKVDIVQCVNSYGIALFRSRKIPYVIRVSDEPYLWRESGFIDFDFEKAKKVYQIDNEMQNWALKRADRVIAPSYFVKEYLSKKYSLDICVIEGPVKIDKTWDLCLKEDNLQIDKYWFSFGYLSYRKQIHVLAYIIDDLLDKYPDMKYVYAGRDREIKYEGEYVKVTEIISRNVKKNIDRVVFLGEISDRERLFSIIKNARLCILPTRMDNLPNTCMEAMVMNKIVVSSTSDYGTSVEQIIEDGVSGFLAYADDNESLKSKVIEAMEIDDMRRTEIERNAGNRIAGMEPSIVYAKMKELYEREIMKYCNN